MGDVCWFCPLRCGISPSSSSCCYISLYLCEGSAQSVGALALLTLTLSNTFQTLVDMPCSPLSTAFKTCTCPAHYVTLLLLSTLLRTIFIPSNANSLYVNATSTQASSARQPKEKEGRRVGRERWPSQEKKRNTRSPPPPPKLKYLADEVYTGFDTRRPRDFWRLCFIFVFAFFERAHHTRHTSTWHSNSHLGIWHSAGEPVEIHLRTPKVEGERSDMMQSPLQRHTCTAAVATAAIQRTAAAVPDDHLSLRR